MNQRRFDILSPEEQNMNGMERTVRAFVYSLVAIAVLAGLFLTGQAAAAGLDDNLAAGMTLWQGLILCVIVAAIGILILATTEGKSVLGWIVLALPAIAALLIVLVSLNPSVPTGQQQQTTATYDVTNVAASLSNYTPALKMVSSVIAVNKTTPSMNSTATYILVNFTIVRTDPGSAIDVRSVTFSYSPTSITSASTGISYSVAKPNGDGRPNVNWTVTAGTSVTTASRTLSGSAGMTPYQVINVACSIEYNPNAFGVSQTNVNDVISLGTWNIAGVVFTGQAVVSAVWT